VPAVAPDPTTPPEVLQLPVLAPLPPEDHTRALALIEESGEGFDAAGEEIEGPIEALLGTVINGVAVKRLWADAVTENPNVGETEVWEFYNTTGDAHPMHIHEVAFEVVNRQDILVNEETLEVELVPDSETPPESWETGVKDTVTALPGQVTRVKMHFTNPGQFVWHCHIVEHEDNEMMRPYRIGPVQPGQPE
jgi:FtsP/CotA-like multicopper oxidase with cupredoxin domain